MPITMNQHSSSHSSSHSTPTALNASQESQQLREENQQLRRRLQEFEALQAEITQLREKVHVLEKAATAAAAAAENERADEKEATVQVDTGAFKHELLEAARTGDAEKVEALLAKGADPNGGVIVGEATPDVMRFRKDWDQHGPTVEGLTPMQANERLRRFNLSMGLPLHDAAERGHTAVVKALLAKGADPQASNALGDTAAIVALRNKYPMIVALIDPEMARQKGDELREDFAAAEKVHVLSTRFNKPSETEVKAWPGVQKQNDGAIYCTGPKEAAATTKLFLEEGRLIALINPTTTPVPSTLVFDPNADNAFLMIGDATNANAIWLQNWRTIGLDNAKKTGGSVIQVLVQGGPSEMQKAEESMANDAGVPVVKLHFDDKAYSPSEMEPLLTKVAMALTAPQKVIEERVVKVMEAVVIKAKCAPCLQRDGNS